jgi:outer membrane protein assembly factor BamA
MSGNNYRQKKETIFGLTYYRSSAGSFPDPSKGYRLSATTEVGGHILDAGDAFVRSSLEYDRDVELKKGHKLAVRLKGGGGHPKDKYLFYLGSDCQLRGYDYKEIKGSAFCLGSLEYRFPLMRDIDARWCYNVLNLDEVQAVLFFDAGTAWFDRFNESGFRKDAGLGFRFYFNVAGAAERVALRVDVAHPLDEPGGDTRVWVGVNHVF